MTNNDIIELLIKDKEQRGECYISDAINETIKILKNIELVKSEIERYIDKEKLAFDGQFDNGLNFALKIVNKYLYSEVE